ncbi:hypothetical protein PVAP13_5KG768701 [Panicum virgatum]|uniref:Uncharacterized protein n=1 Tax=Panicum virgatum TaxID=38727 RepID=A0A8T0SUW5_PANVG|nr:hypothetical protein PVAP13_5KG768701 [Panicum virgatum]
MLHPSKERRRPPWRCRRRRTGSSCGSTARRLVAATALAFNHNRPSTPGGDRTCSRHTSLLFSHRSGQRWQRRRCFAGPRTPVAAAEHRLAHVAGAAVRRPSRTLDGRDSPSPLLPLRRPPSPTST